MSRRKQQSAFDQVSEFDRGRILAYLDCGLSFRKIGSRVTRNQTTVMRICDRWMQEGMTDQRGRSHPPQCTTAVSARTIRCRLHQSGLSVRSPLLGLALTQNHRGFHRQWCDERRICSTIDPDYAPSCHNRPTLATCGNSLVCCTPRTHPKSLSINDEACGSGDLQQWRLL
ncbi:transposable element Tcb1 transposase [Trichonephila clavipes]|nr:transposable element Tcb1 transposase [Trichonephila clavipes]